MITTLAEFLNADYNRFFIRDTDGSYFAYVKELPGCMTEGDTREDAEKMLTDAMELWYLTAIEEGREIPQPEVRA